MEKGQRKGASPESIVQACTGGRLALLLVAWGNEIPAMQATQSHTRVEPRFTSTFSAEISVLFERFASMILPL